MSENSGSDEALYKNSTFPIGCALSLEQLQNDQLYNQIATLHFNSVTPENIFKTNLLYPSPEHFDFAEADRLVGYCKFHKKRVHGHPLVWHEQVPHWITQFDGDAQAWEMLLGKYVKEVVTNFKGLVAAWDVVNEAFTADGTLRETIWKNRIGADYIAKSFRWAKEADPHAFLFYNDFDLESNPVKRKAVLDYINKLRSEGVPVDGIGIQMHINIRAPSIGQISEAFKEISDAGFIIHLSEMDISVYPQVNEVKEIEELLQKQAVLLEKIIIEYKALPSAQQYGITFWGVSDKDSWLRHNLKRVDHPLLFNDQFEAKPSFYKLKACL